LAAFIAQERASRAPTAEKGGAHAGFVPDSVRAGVLSGLVVSFLTVAIGIEHSAELGESLGWLTINGATVPIVPLILLGSLWGGARATASALFVVHWAMKRMSRTGLVDYALAGAAVGLVYAGIVAAIGFGLPDHGWTFEAATGAVAGALYRLFAGTAKRY
jgi:hypothetical protein